MFKHPIHKFLKELDNFLFDTNYKDYSLDCNQLFQQSMPNDHILNTVDDIIDYFNIMDDEIM